MSESKGQRASSEVGYTVQRAELLARLVLTRRKDIEVISIGQATDTGMDLFVRVRQPVMNGQALPMFGVQIKGTNNPLPDAESANAYINRGKKHRDPRGLFLFPIVLFLFSMDGDTGYYSWLMKPVVGGKRPTLRIVEAFEMVKIDRHSVDAMLSQIVNWFEAMGDVLEADDELG